MHFLIVLAVLGQVNFSDGPIANRDTPYNVTTAAGAAFLVVPINVAVTTTSFKIKGFRYAAWEMVYTWSAATAVTMTCQYSEDQTTWFDLHVKQVTTFPTVISLPRIESYTVSASHNWTWPIALMMPYVRCTFTATGGGVGDTLTLRMRAGF